MQTGSAMAPVIGNYATLPDLSKFLKDNQIDPREYQFQEVGQSGTLNFGGFLDGTEEWVSDLKSYQLYKTIDYMRTDAIIGAIERGYSMPVEQGEISFAYDRPDAINNPMLARNLAFIQDDFNRINKQNFLHNAIMYKPYGFAAFEKCFEVRSDGLIHLSRLAPRMSKTAFRWIIDGYGNLRWLIQLVYTPKPDGGNGAWEYKAIPAEKLLLITGSKEGGNFSGRSAYRPYYREWKIKDNALKQIAIAINRVGVGIPFARISNDAPETVKAIIDGDTFENLSLVRQVENGLKRLQGGENAYMAAKWIEEIKLLTIDPGALQGILTIIKYADESMAKAAFQPLLNLGTSSTGSRALGESFENMTYEALRGDSETIVAAYNEQVIKPIIIQNFGEFEEYPKMQHKLSPDLSEIGKTLKMLHDAGLVDGNTELENFIMKHLGLPETTDANRKTVPAPVPAVPAVVPSVEPEAPEAPEANLSNHHTHEIELSEKRVGRPLHAAWVTMRRKPTATENRLINLSETADNLNSIHKNCARELRQIAQPAMIDMARQLGAGAKIYQVHPNWGNRIADLFRKYYKEVKNQAAADVKAEIQKQNKNLHLSEIQLAVKKAKTKPAQTTPDYDAKTSSEADAASVQFQADIEQAVAGYYSAGFGSCETGAALQSYITQMIMDEAASVTKHTAGG